jgi:Zn-finger nucleic acid-binding protein
MNRVAFGHRSGVVIDQCKSHGVWLDGGEISHLLEWKKAGGQLLDQKKQAELQQKKRSSKVSNPEIENLMKAYSDRNGEIDLLESVASVIFKVFE